MDDMSNNKPVWEKVLEVVLDAKGENPVVLETSRQCSWGDYMLVVTAASQAHLRGIYGRLTDFIKDQNDLVPHNHPSVKDENRWLLVDWGDMVVHIMTKEAREYYNLEDIWFESPVLFRESDQSSSSS